MKDEKTTEENVVVALSALITVCVLLIAALFFCFFPASVPALVFVGAFAWAIYKKCDI